MEPGGGGPHARAEAQGELRAFGERTPPSASTSGEQRHSVRTCHEDEVGGVLHAGGVPAAPVVGVNLAVRPSRSMTATTRVSPILGAAHLIDGDALCGLLKRHRVGEIVRERIVEDISVDDAWWDEQG